MRPAVRAACRGGMAAAAVFLALSLVAAGTGCGKKEGPSAQSASQAIPGGPSGGEAPAAARGEISVPAGGGSIVVVAPSSPSLISPPSVSVKSPPGQGAEIIDVKWFVNGAEKESGQALPPSSFRRGDAIKAIVKLRAGGGEARITTPEVTAVNALPAVEEAGMEPRAPVSGGSVRIIVRGSDPDGDPLTYKFQWYVDDQPVPGGETIVLKGVKKGSWVHASASPNDGFADGAWKYTPKHQVVNAPPVVKSNPPTSVPPSRLLTHTITAEDPDGDPLTFVLEKGPEGATLSGATLTWKVSDGDLGRTAEIVIRISDDDGASTVLSMNLNPRKP